MVGSGGSATLIPRRRAARILSATHRPNHIPPVKMTAVATSPPNAASATRNQGHERVVAHWLLTTAAPIARAHSVSHQIRCNLPRYFSADSKAALSSTSASFLFVDQVVSDRLVCWQASAVPATQCTARFSVAKLSDDRAATRVVDPILTGRQRRHYLAVLCRCQYPQKSTEGACDSASLTVCCV